MDSAFVEGHCAPTTTSTTTSRCEDDSPTTYDKTLQAILCPTRLNALNSSDIPPVPYNTYSLTSNILSIHGRNFSMLALPLLYFFLWGLLWWIIFFNNWIDADGKFQEYVASLSELVDPLVTPLSFLMTFRLGRAAVRWWEARSSAGKIVAICRCNISMVSAALMHNRKQKIRNEIDTKIRKYGDEEENELLCEYSRWLAVFPIAVKHFLRPATRPGWEKDDRYNHVRLEIGALLSDEDIASVMKEYDDDDGNPTFDACSAGYRVRDAPLVVLNHLHRLTYGITHCSFSADPDLLSSPTLHNGRGAFLETISGQLNQLFDAYGAMERIQGSPLPFVYAIHLRFFLLVYLLLWNLTSVAEYGWLSLPFLFLFNWSLLGIEAAAVVCESPFHYNPNHLTLGKVAVLVARNIAQAMTQSRYSS